MPKLLGQSLIFKNMRATSIDSDELVHGVACYGLKLTRKNGSLFRLWVDKATFIILESDDETADVSTTMHGRANFKLTSQHPMFTPPRVR